MKGLGVPALFRDDPELAAVNNSSVFWTQFAITIVLLLIWTYIYHFEKLEHISTSSSTVGDQVPLRHFILFYGAPMTLYILGAAALPWDDASLQYIDAFKGFLGIVSATQVFLLIIILIQSLIKKVTEWGGHEPLRMGVVVCLLVGTIVGAGVGVSAHMRAENILEAVLGAVVNIGVGAAFGAIVGVIVGLGLGAVVNKGRVAGTVVGSIVGAFAGTFIVAVLNTNLGSGALMGAFIGALMGIVIGPYGVQGFLNRFQFLMVGSQALSESYQSAEKAEQTKDILSLLDYLRYLMENLQCLGKKLLRYLWEKLRYLGRGLRHPWKSLRKFWEKFPQFRGWVHRFLFEKSPESTSESIITGDRRMRSAWALGFLTIMWLGLQLVALWGVIQAGVSIVLLMCWVLLVLFFLGFLRPFARFWVVVIAVILITVIRAPTYKYSLPGFQVMKDGEKIDYYKKPVNLWKEPDSDKLLDPIVTLNNWREGIGKKCENLIIVSTSGGAYRAAYWTAAVFDKLESLANEGSGYENLSNCIRLVTGASGGMVGSAYYVAMKNEVANKEEHDEHLPISSVVERLNRDTLCARARKEMREELGCIESINKELDPHYPTFFPYSRDSLTPVAHQLVREDIHPLKLIREPTTKDRGRVLEDQWLTLDQTFSELSNQEKSGRIPSLFVTPLAFWKEKYGNAGESFAMPLVISNQNTPSHPADNNRNTMTLFDLFPDVLDEFKVKTAIRMNATFPYVSPALALPTMPQVRVVDAGYYENYGIAAAASWLVSKPDSNRKETSLSPLEWLKREGLGVILIQIRAYPYASSPFATLVKKDRTCPEVHLISNNVVKNVQTNTNYMDKMLQAMKDDALKKLKKEIPEELENEGEKGYLTCSEINDQLQRLIDKQIKECHEQAKKQIPKQAHQTCAEGRDHLVDTVFDPVTIEEIIRKINDKNIPVYVSYQRSSLFQSITSPLEAVMAVRDSAMNMRNDQEINLIGMLFSGTSNDKNTLRKTEDNVISGYLKPGKIEWLADEQIDLLRKLVSEVEIETISIENTKDVGMSWYLKPEEVKWLQKEVDSEFNKAQLKRLACIAGLKDSDDSCQEYTQ